MVGFLRVRRWEKRNKINFYWVCVGSIQYSGIETFWKRKLCMNFLIWKVLLNLSNYTTKSDVKNLTVVDTSKFIKKLDFSCWESEVDELEV